jgi:multiple sugar transport system ATP-binding protein
MGTISLKNVRKAFGDTVIIPGADLDINDGEFVVFVGPSGCGKSTLLRMIAGLEDTTSGTIHIDGVDVSNAAPSERGLAMVFQSYALYPHMSVRNNIAFPLKMAKAPQVEIDAKVNAAAAKLNLTEYLDRKPRQLSGGQRQRVAIGRAIVREPKAFLFDEPLSNLDAALRVNMRIEIMQMHQSMDATMVYVTHDQVEAMTMADRIVVLNKGVIEQVGSPLELYNKPKSLFVAGFIGSPKMNLLDGKVAKLSGRKAEIEMLGGSKLVIKDAAGLATGQKLTVGLRPEMLGLSKTGVIAGKVAVIEHLGSETLCYVDVGNKVLVTAKLPSTATIQPGQTVQLAVTSGEPLLFNEQGAALRS